jgi:hypothetical protein
VAERLSYDEYLRELVYEAIDRRSSDSKAYGEALDSIVRARGRWLVRWYIDCAEVERIERERRGEWGHYLERLADWLDKRDLPL